MIARELDRVLRRVRARTGGPALHAARRSDLPLERERLLPRECWERDPLPRRRLLRGPGVRARDARGRLGEGLPPGAAVLHAHDYGALEFIAPLLRRVPRAARDDRPRGAARSREHGARRALVARDARWMREQGMPPARRRAGCRARPRTTAGAAWSPRSARAPTRLPDRVQRALSLEGRRCARDRAPEREGPRRGAHRRTRRSCSCMPKGPAPLEEPVRGDGRARRRSTSPS